ncbi:xanthine dehydrogenase family protein molybdopterin-binding subunit, partial [Propylenella binzhouense]
MNGIVGQPVSRVDGAAKVTGGARYAAEFAVPGLVHAALVASTVAKGLVAAIDIAAAAAAPGVLAVLTHENAMRLPYRPMERRPAVDPKAGEQLKVLQGPEILFCGQPVALVVAESPEQAVHAAGLVAVREQPEPAATAFDTDGAYSPSEASAKAGRAGETRRGDAEAAFRAAPVTIDATYTLPREHHNAMELHATIASWEGERLTLFDKTQWVDNDRNEIAHVFGIPKEDIRVISPFVGGAFGSALRTWPHVALAALAARHVGRPVRLELTRRELYSMVGFRPHTVQRLRLGAERDGRLRAIAYEGVGQTSAYEEYAETAASPARNTYSCPNVATKYRLAAMNTNTPTPMRAPGIVTGNFALEAAMDELAKALGLDPLELRLRNYAERDEAKDLPWSSKELRTCYARAAERFGWARRSPAPRSMREGHDLIGWGMATAIYHADRAPASASAALFANGTATIRSAASDMGPGTYTAMTQIAADALGLPLERVRFELGDTDMPPAPVHGGSITAASIGNAVHAACEALKAKLGEAARVPGGPFAGRDAGAIVARDGGLAAG